MIKIKDYIIAPTIFPDNTSQVWQLPCDIIGAEAEIKILWEFQYEQEVITILQLSKLLWAQFRRPIVIDCPYLPYGRQDKHISNNTTFALSVFLDIMKQPYISQIITLDVHNPNVLKGSFIYNESPRPQILETVEKCRPDILCFPDSGALLRYKKILQLNISTISCSKIRDQITGKIINVTVPIVSENYNSVLIIDDICDGGRTFITIAQQLKNQGPIKKVYLYCTHGIFSNGLKYLFDNGIDKVFTYKGEQNNE